MKKVIFLLLILILPLQAYCQVVEDFESGNPAGWIFSTPGRWAADVSSISGKYSLHHIFDNTEAGTDQAGLSVKNLHPEEDTTTWSFLAKHGCDPSSSNNWAVLLMSDSDPQRMLPGGGMRGFVVGVNFTGSDDTLRLWKVSGTGFLPVNTSRINWQTDIGINSAARITLTRTPGGEWTMLVSGTDGKHLSESHGSDSQLFHSEWFGMFYRYSSTRDRLFWFDDLKITGSFHEDITPPSVTSVRVAGKKSIEVTFSETPAEASLKPENFIINGREINPVLQQKTSLAYIISSEDIFKNKELNFLQVNNICDESGNCSASAQVTFTPVFPETGDVVITEIMADPVPSVSLPPFEYLEITNRTGYSFNLKDWSLTAEGRSTILPAFNLHAGKRLVLCEPGDTAAFRAYGDVMGLKSFPLLSDEGMKLSLSDSTGTFVHGIGYDSKWYDRQLKESGGWSLEMIDERYPFYDEGNWVASNSRTGGTPGQENSVAGGNPDENFRGIVNVFPLSPGLIKVDFSEYVHDLESWRDLAIDKGIRIKGITVADQLHRSFIIETGQSLEKGIIYLFRTYSSLVDFAGNQAERNGFNFGLAEQPAKSDILFNELLFNPLPGDPDFIEFFNNSGRIIDASRLYVSSVSDADGDTSSMAMLSGEHRCFNPMTFFVITTDRKKLMSRYISSDPDVIFEVARMPSMNDDKGHLVLLSRELDRIDEVYYDEQMHYRMLNETEGISLERVSPSTSSVNRSSWHSASETSGWATPGRGNSVFAGELQAAEEIILSSTKLSPDNNGFEDVLKIYLYSKENGNILTVNIFDETGGHVRKLSERLLAGPREELIWDGTADDGTLVRAGIYIIFCEMYNASGKVRKWKKVCAVVR